MSKRSLRLKRSINKKSKEFTKNLKVLSRRSRFNSTTSRKRTMILRWR